MTPIGRLIANSDEFGKEVVRVAPDLYVAVGFAVSSVAVLETCDGLVIVDTTESTTATAEILGEFREILSKPFHTVVVTHGHRDRVSSIRLLCEGGSPQIVARTSLHNELDPSNNGRSPTQILIKRAARPFGIPLKPHSERLLNRLGAESLKQ